MTYETILVETRGKVALITLNRSKALNALTLGMVRQIEAALDEFEAAADISAVLLTGEGERGLCAGGDIRAIHESGRAGTTLAERLTDAGVAVQPVTWSMGLDPRVVATLLGELTAGTVVHAHDSHAHTLADAAIRIRKAHLVVTRRVDFPIRQAARWRRVDRTIALSGPVRDRLVAAGVAPDRISVIPPAVSRAAHASGTRWAAG